MCDTVRQVFKDGKIPNRYKRDISVMRALAHDSSQVPPRHQVEPDTLSVDGDVIACGTSSEIRKGRLGNKTVAIRTLKADRQVDLRDVQKVCHIQRHIPLGCINKYGTQTSVSARSL